MQLGKLSSRIKGVAETDVRRTKMDQSVTGEKQKRKAATDTHIAILPDIAGRDESDWFWLGLRKFALAC